MPSTRRTFLRSAAAVSVGAVVAGCSSQPSTYPSEEPSGPVHLELKNCSGKDLDVSLTVVDIASGETVHDVTHTVPEGFCSDMGSTFSVYEVWNGDGRYRVRATVPSGNATFERVVVVDHSSIRGSEAAERVTGELRLVAGEESIDATVQEGGRWANETTSNGP